MWEVPPSSLPITILASYRSFIAFYEAMWASNTVTIPNNHQSGLAWTCLLIFLYPSTNSGVISSHVYVSIKVLVFSMIFDPGFASYFRRKSSVNPLLTLLPFVRNTVGPVSPAALPVLNIVIESLQSYTLDPFFLWNTAPRNLTTPCFDSITQVSSPPIMKWSINSPKVLLNPHLHKPVLLDRKKLIAELTNLCQQYCCATVVAFF